MEREQYEEFKKLLAETEAEKFMDDKYPRAYIVSRGMFPDGTEFISFQTGCNRDHVISFAKSGAEVKWVLTGCRRNYGNYTVHLTEDGTVCETTRYSFGGSLKKYYDKDLKFLYEKKEENFGCCAG